jgi:hypothetical protein
MKQYIVQEDGDDGAQALDEVGIGIVDIDWVNGRDSS